MRSIRRTWSAPVGKHLFRSFFPRFAARHHPFESGRISRGRRSFFQRSGDRASRHDGAGHRGERKKNRIHEDHPRPHRSDRGISFQHRIRDGRFAPIAGAFDEHQLGASIARTVGRDKRHRQAHRDERGGSRAQSPPADRRVLSVREDGRRAFRL